MRSWCKRLSRGSPGFHSWPVRWDPGRQWLRLSGTGPGAAGLRQFPTYSLSLTACTCMWSRHTSWTCFSLWGLIKNPKFRGVWGKLRERPGQIYFLSNFMGFKDCIKTVLLHPESQRTVGRRDKWMLIVQCPDHIVYYISLRVSEAVNRTGEFSFSALNFWWKQHCES